jgi:hypothetical protein
MEVAVDGRGRKDNNGCGRTRYPVSQVTVCCVHVECLGQGVQLSGLKIGKGQSGLSSLSSPHSFGRCSKLHSFMAAWTLPDGH